MKCTTYTTSLAVAMTLGGLCGGPIGFLLAKLLHSGIVCKLGLEATGIAGGAYLGRKAHRRCQRYHPAGPETDTLLETRRVTFHPTPDYRAISPRPSEEETEQEFTRLVEIVKTDEKLSRSHRNILTTYHQAVSDGHCPLEEVAEAQEDWCNVLLLTYQPVQDYCAVDLAIYAERILMMSLYSSVYQYCCEQTKTNDQTYLVKRASHNEYRNIPNSIIDKLNQLPDRVTGSLKIAC